jgi:hypothetical protein
VSIAAIFNIPSNIDELNSWAFAHADHHRNLNAYIQARTGVTMPQYVLDPINSADVGTWLFQHQDLHSQMDAILGISGYDLLDVDLTDEGQLSAWIWLVANEHYQAADITGVA